MNPSISEWAFPGDQDSVDALLRLVYRLHTSNICMLAGAGIAVTNGFPTWDGLLTELGDSILDMGTRKLLAGQKDKLWRAEEYRRELSESRYFEFLQRRFGPQSKSVSEDLLNIVRLNCKHVFTTNYDVSLEEAHTKVFRTEPVGLDWDKRDAVRIFLSRLGEVRTPKHYVHLHGRFDQPSQIIFTYRDYMRRYVETDEMVHQLFVLFTIRSFLFLGFSLEDPDLAQILRLVTSRLGKGDHPAHFAVVPMNDGEALAVERRRLRGKYDVEPIFYRMDTAQPHRNLSRLVSLLCRLQDAHDPSALLSSEGTSRFQGV